MGSSLAVSLIQGKTPSEAVQILAEQIDSLFGRVDDLENQQVQSNEDIERLKAENEELRLQVDTVLSETEDIRTEKSRHDRCAEIAKQLTAKGSIIQAPFLERMESLNNEYNGLRKALLESMRTYPLNSKEVADAQERADAKSRELQVVTQEMEDALKESRETPAMKALIEEAKELGCA
jgi:chromosome segregation ATPase